MRQAAPTTTTALIRFTRRILRGFHKERCDYSVTAEPITNEQEETHTNNRLVKSEQNQSREPQPNSLKQAETVWQS
jgi:NifB/MoaA-like Fe-S oxidoreductase